LQPSFYGDISSLKAEVAHLVEHDLAKVGVAGSSPVFRSQIPPWRDFFSLFHCPGGGTGRHAGLKILWPAMAVTVQLRSGAHFQPILTDRLFKLTSMRTFIICCLVSIMVSCNDKKTPQPAASAPLTETEVKAFIEAYDKAWHDRDTMKMKEMMDEKYIYFTSNGLTRTRGNILGWFNPADKYKMDTAYRNEIAITLNGDVAIVSTHWVGNGTFGTEKFDDDQRCGLVIQKVNDKLKLVSEHCVQIEK
jgi:ketosteroid isomerase-like protein